MKAFLFGMCCLVVLLLAQVWPRAGGVWLVRMPLSMPPGAAASAVLSHPVRLIDAVGDNIFIVKAVGDANPAALLRQGALLVVETSGIHGCTPPTSKPAWAKPTPTLANTENTA
jgi:hypothetical protein